MQNKINKTNLKLPILLIILPIILVLLGTNMQNFTLRVVFSSYYEIVDSFSSRNEQDAECLDNQRYTDIRIAAKCGPEPAMYKKNEIADTLYANSNIISMASTIVATPVFIIGIVLLKKRLKNRKTNLK